MNIKELPVTEHKLLLTARVNQTQEHYALVTVPRILSRIILSWAQEYVGQAEGQQHSAQAKRRALYMLDDLISRVQAGHMVMDMVLAEGVAERFVERCVEKVQELTLGGQA